MIQSILGEIMKKTFLLTVLFILSSDAFAFNCVYDEPVTVTCNRTGGGTSSMRSQACRNGSGAWVGVKCLSGQVSNPDFVSITECCNASPLSTENGIKKKLNSNSANQ